MSAPDPAPSPPVFNVTVTQPPGWADLVREVQRLADSFRQQPSPTTFTPEWWLDWAPILLGVVTAGVAVLTIWRALSARPVPLASVKSHSTGPTEGSYAFDGDIAYTANVGRLAMIVEGYGLVESNGTLTKRNGTFSFGTKTAQNPDVPFVLKPGEALSLWFPVSHGAREGAATTYALDWLKRDWFGRTVRKRYTFRVAPLNVV